MKRINFYVFMQILKACTLIFFIFISISWLLQVTRLFTLTNLIQVDILTVLFLSLYLIPNLTTVILPFVIIFGILLCFLKLNRDRELIAIYSLGLNTKAIRGPILFFSLILSIFFIILNFYYSPNIYEKYKIKEFEIRNTINLEKMILSNFLEINKDTVIDFKKRDNNFEQIFINFKDEYENVIYAENGNIINKNSNFVFELTNGFKLSIKDNEIEKLEFENYLLKINKNQILKYENFDNNTFNIFEDIKTKNYINISYKIFDTLIVLLIIFFYYQNNILKNKFDFKSNTFYILLSIFILIINQLLKNSEINLNIYLTINTILCLSIISTILFKRIKYV